MPRLSDIGHSMLRLQVCQLGEIHHVQVCSSVDFLDFFCIKVHCCILLYSVQVHSTTTNWKLKKKNEWIEKKKKQDQTQVVSRDLNLCIWYFFTLISKLLHRVDAYIFWNSKLLGINQETCLKQLFTRIISLQFTKNLIRTNSRLTTALWTTRVSRHWQQCVVHLCYTTEGSIRSMPALQEKRKKKKKKEWVELLTTRVCFWHHLSGPCILQKHFQSTVYNFTFQLESILQWCDWRMSYNDVSASFHVQPLWFFARLPWSCGSSGSLISPRIPAVFVP